MRNYSISCARTAITTHLRRARRAVPTFYTLQTRGIDFDLSYGSSLGLFGDGRIDLNALYTRTLRHKTQSDPSPPLDSGVGNLE